MELYLLREHLMSADEDVNLTRLELLGYASRILCRLCAVDILHGYGQVAQTLREGAVVLQCKDCGGHKDCRLLAIACSFEGGAYGNLGLAEAHIATYQSVHRLVGLHVALDGSDGGLLVGRILPLERCLELLLQVSILRKGKARRGLTLGIEGDKFARYILYGLLGRSLKLLPCAISELVNLRWLALATLVARDAV